MERHRDIFIISAMQLGEKGELKTLIKTRVKNMILITLVKTRVKNRTFNPGFPCCRLHASLGK